MLSVSLSFVILLFSLWIAGAFDYFLFFVPKILTATVQLGLELYFFVLALSLFKGEDTRTFLKRTAVFFSVYFAFQILLAGYFAVKCKSAATCTPLDFAGLERPLWNAVYMIDKLVPLPLWKVFSVIYEVVWSISATLFFLMAVYGSPSLRARRVGVVFLLYSLSALLHYLFYGLSPVYCYGELQSLIPHQIGAWQMHESSLHDTEALKAGELFFPVFPVACFPSLHVAWVYFLKKEFPGKLSAFLFWTMTVLAVLLGFHYLIDVVAGVLLVEVCYRIFYKLSSKTEDFCQKQQKS